MNENDSFNYRVLGPECIVFFIVVDAKLLCILKPKTIFVSVVIRVHDYIGNDKDASHAEDDIIARFRDILRVKSLDEASRILDDIDLTIIAAKKGHSVVLY